jgi:hypothetical protein
MNHKNRTRCCTSDSERPAIRISIAEIGTKFRKEKELLLAKINGEKLISPSQRIIMFSVDETQNSVISLVTGERAQRKGCIL